MLATKITSSATTASPENYDVEYRAIPDDAWYSVRTLFDGEKLTVKYENFTDDDDNVFRPDDFNSLQEVEEFKERFRPLSVQVQDNECKSVAEGMVVCASCCFTKDDIRFFDAFVDAVTARDHCVTSGEEQCMCNFVVTWKHGPVAGNLANRKIENICLPQTNFQIDPTVASFLNLVGKKLEAAAHEPHLISSCNTPHEHILSSPMERQSTFSSQTNEGTDRAWLAVTNQWKSQEMDRMCYVSERIKEETDVGGDDNHCFVIGNLDKDLSPSAIVEFIHSQTSVSVHAYVFPSLPSDTYTKGIIALDGDKDLKKLCEFLDSLNHIIVSWRGRPWVVAKKISRNVLPFGTLMAKYQLEHKSTGIGRMKVVHSGSEEYEIAKQLRDMFMDFVEHQERLHKALALEEKRTLLR